MERFGCTLLLLLLLLASVISICSADNLPASSDRSAADFVRQSCNATQYPDVCEQCLSSYGPAVHRSKRQLARAALGVSAARARSAAAFVSQMLAGGKGSLGRQPAGETGAVADCSAAMRNGLDQLWRSFREMERMGRAQSRQFRWHIESIKTWVSAALTYQTTCLDELSQTGAEMPAAIRKVKESVRVTSNALALVNQIDTEN